MRDRRCSYRRNAAVLDTAIPAAILVEMRTALAALAFVVAADGAQEVEAVRDLARGAE
jgi:hypothetical protein